MNYRTAYEINLKNGEAIIRRCIPIARNVHCDVLDCQKSWAREATDKPWEEILELALKEGHRAHWIFNRRDMSFIRQDDYYDVGVSTMTHIDYFIFIELEVEAGKKVIEEFDLKLKEW